MTLLRRHRPATPRPRIAITTPDPADEVRCLRGLIEDLRLVICTLASEVGQLRRRFTDVRGITTESVEPGEPLGSFGPVSDTTGDAVADAARLSAAFDLLHEHADALWFERQWLTAQIGVAQTTLGRARTQASTGQWPATDLIDSRTRVNEPGWKGSDTR